jgi:hypothetical protein
MSNPFVEIFLQAYEAYHKINPSAASAASAQRHTIPKSLLYIIGTSFITAILYKSLKNRNATLFHFLTPFKYLLNRRKTTTTQELLFEDKYFSDYDEWSENQPQTPTAEDNYVIVPAPTTDKKECLEKLFNITIRETINEFYGDVIMCYDHATFSFAYYGRTANIPYKYLETISRKYMIETNAPREIHVDIRDEYKKAKERTIPVPAPAEAPASAPASAPANANDPATNDENVFVKLKSYNTVSNLNIHTTTNDTNEKTHKFVTPSGTATESKASTSSSTKIIREKANRYSYRGKIQDFDENHKRPSAVVATATATATATDADAAEVKDYAEYKKQMMNMRSAL